MAPEFQTTDRQLRDQAWEDLQGYLGDEGWLLEESGFDSILSVATHQVVHIDLCTGGPATWIEYDLTDNRATFHTTAPAFHANLPSRTETVILDEITRDRLANLLGMGSHE